MSIVYHGIDLVDCSRIERMFERHGRHFLERVFTPAEQDYAQRYKNPAERLAGRFAVKEAVMKMLGTGWSGGVAWTDVETLNTTSGKPQVHLHGTLLELAGQMGIEQISVSITHARGLAFASVVGLDS